MITPIISVEHQCNFVNVLLRGYTYTYIRIVILNKVLMKIFEVKIGGRIRNLRDLPIVMINAQL